MEFFSEWRTADRVACAAEKAVLEKSLGALDGRTAPPAPSESARARALRNLANDLFMVAMDEMRNKSGVFAR